MAKSRFVARESDVVFTRTAKAKTKKKKRKKKRKK